MRGGTGPDVGRTLRAGPAVSQVGRSVSKVVVVGAVSEATSLTTKMRSSEAA